jgi:hypothetical protein
MTATATLSASQIQTLEFYQGKRNVDDTPSSFINSSRSLHRLGFLSEVASDPDKPWITHYVLTEKGAA